MSRILVIAWRDFCQTVMRKVFLIAIVGIPLLVVGSVGVMVLILKGHKQPPLIGTVAVVDPSGAVAPAAAREFEPRNLAAERQAAQKELDTKARNITGRT